MSLSELGPGREAAVKQAYDAMHKSILFEMQHSNRGDFRYGAPGYVLQQRVNLIEETQGLPANFVLWDVGCGTGAGDRDFVLSDPDIRVLAINDHKLPDPWGATEWPDRLSFIAAYMEDLDGREFLAKAKAMGKYPPDIVMFQNSLKYVESMSTLDVVFRGLGQIMKKGSKVLIYEDEGEVNEFYRVYEDKIRQLRGPFRSEILSNGQDVLMKPTYLKLTRI